MGGNLGLLTNLVKTHILPAMTTTHSSLGPCLDCGREHYLVKGRCILCEDKRLRAKARDTNAQEDWDALSDLQFYIEDTIR